jgi:hypothetical protein
MKYSPGLATHIYRADFMNNEIVLSVDGNAVLTAMDNRFINSGKVGLANGQCQLQVPGFKVLAP